MTRASSTAKAPFPLYDALETGCASEKTLRRFPASSNHAPKNGFPSSSDPVRGAVTMPLLTVKGLKTHFQTQEGTVRAVDGVDFTLGEGESLGLAGESGSGKTTAALSIIRLLPSNGKIVDGTIDYVGDAPAKAPGGPLRAIRRKPIPTT